MKFKPRVTNTRAARLRTLYRLARERHRRDAVHGFYAARDLDFSGETLMMQKLADEERQLLRHYGERERVISGLQRTFAHQYLLDLGYIKEQSVNIQELLVVVTEAGRKVLSSPP